jgi:hypothetical protein
MWKNNENQHKNHAFVTFVEKSWIRLPSFLVYIFTWEDAAFHELSPGFIKFVEDPHFSAKKFKLLEKNWKNHAFFPSKNHRIDPFFSLNDACTKSKNIWIDRKKVLFLLGKVSTKLILKIRYEIYNILNSTKNDSFACSFIRPLIMTYVIIYQRMIRKS